MVHHRLVAAAGAAAAVVALAVASASTPAEAVRTAPRWPDLSPRVTAGTSVIIDVPPLGETPPATLTLTAVDGDVTVEPMPGRVDRPAEVHLWCGLAEIRIDQPSIGRTVTLAPATTCAQES